MPRDTAIKPLQARSVNALLCFCSLPPSPLIGVMPTRAKTPSQRYAAVPQSPRALQSGPRPPKNPASSPPPRNAQPVDTQHTPYADYSTHQAGRNAAAAGVATGAVGLAYGPYSVCLYQLDDFQRWLLTPRMIVRSKSITKCGYVHSCSFQRRSI